MKVAPWNPVRISANPQAFRCSHCGMTGGTSVEFTVMGFMRKLRAFEKEHNKCAPAARKQCIQEIATAVISTAMQPRETSTPT